MGQGHPDGPAWHHLLQYLHLSGRAQTDATNMSLLATTSPVVMAAIAHLFLHERLSRFQILGLCGALFGVVVLVSRGKLDTLLVLRFAQGDLWMILSVFLFAVYSLMLRCRPNAFPQKAFLALLIGIGVIGSSRRWFGRPPPPA